VAALQALRASSEALAQKLKARQGAEAEHHMLQEQVEALQELQAANIRMLAQLEARASVESDRRHLQASGRAGGHGWQPATMRQPTAMRKALQPAAAISAARRPLAASPVAGAGGPRAPLPPTRPRPRRRSWLSWQRCRRPTGSSSYRRKRGAAPRPSSGCCRTS
jgi:hypothetical protein